jgi:hypothetical protein
MRLHCVSKTLVDHRASLADCLSSFGGNCPSFWVAYVLREENVWKLLAIGVVQIDQL